MKWLFVIAALAIAFIALDGHAQQRKQPVPIQPGQSAQCWDVVGTINQTTQCSDGRWQVANPDGSYLTGAGPLPGEYQPLPAENQGAPPMSTFAPSVLFGIPTGRP